MLKFKLILGIAVLLILVVGFFAFKKFTGNVAMENTEKYDWLVDNCECIERENLKCPDGFELEERVCRDKEKNTFTNVLLGCSKYDCNGKVWGVKPNA